MSTAVSGLRTGLLLIATVSAAAGAGAAASPPEPPLRAAEIPGTYELVDRVLANGKVLKAPDIAALYSMARGRANLNLFLRKPDGTLASESSIIRYTLSDTQYCEWIEYTTRNNLDAPGVTNTAPPVRSHCTPLKPVGGRILFAPPGESVTTTYDRHGFTAVIKGEFTDHWRKIE
ncbi:MAG: hypothetical protein JOZ55_07785 [Alphaproteobacteria bacterium]|nr:hypothetical protein [Alphaproteobacteria bacterium]